ncbi:MAG: TatD family hydrolase [Simkaniaceae bacterium]
MKPKLFDTHAHLTWGETYLHLPEILNRAKEIGVERIVNICTDQETLLRGLELGKKENFIFNSGATTPHDVEKEGERLFPLFAKAARDKELLAIGETGLDYFYEHSNKKIQQEFFIRYLHLAKACHLPVIIHCRNAFDDLYAHLDQEFSGKVLLHCFTGSYEEAKKGVDRGFLISMSGIATFKKSSSLRETFAKLPSKNLVIETDTPYLAPQSKRGKGSNEPSYILETCQVLADIKKRSLEEMAKITFENANQFFF